MQLQNGLKKLKKAGIQVAAVSYDPAESLAAFAEKRTITYPLLSDPGSKAIKAFGILNEKADGFAAGVPHPGTFVIDEKGIVRAKIFRSGYRERHTVDELIEVAKKVN